MSRNDAGNVLLMIGVGLVAGSTAATVVQIGVNADAALLAGSIVAVWAAAIVGILARW